MRVPSAVVMCLAFSVVSCGGKSTPTAPTPPQPANIAGLWQGTLTSSNFEPQAIRISLTQAGDRVTGTWANGSSSWTGTVDGTASPSNFTGTFSVSLPRSGGGTCTGSASFSGGCASGAVTMRWTAPGFVGSNCTGMPLGLVMNVQKM